jgi:hypothetical protein
LGSSTDWTVSEGMLHGVENNTAGGMAHLLYEGNTSYQGQPQEVLARVRINSISRYIPPLTAAGVAANVSDPGNQGVNLIASNYANYFDTGYGGLKSDVVMQTNVDGGVKYYPPYIYQDWTWHWFRLDNCDATHSRVKVWPADGVTVEPVDWTWDWEHASVSGFAGLAGPGYYGGGTTDTSFDVDLILIKSASLPRILVPEPGCLLLLAVGGAALLKRLRR